MMMYISQKTLPQIRQGFFTLLQKRVLINVETIQEKKKKEKMGSP